MIYLIGGAPRCGKTTIAKKLSKRLGIPWISADTLESIAATYVPKKDLNRLFPKRYRSIVTKQSNDLLYDTYSAKEMVGFYQRQSKVVWKAIDMMVMVELNAMHDYIIEGHQVHPKLIDKLKEDHGKKNFKSIVVTRYNIEGIVDGSLNNQPKDDWFVRKTKKKETYPKIASMIALYSRFFEREAGKYKLEVVNMDERFVKQVDLVVRKLSKLAQ